MIPSVRTRIDQANGEGENAWHREPISATEMAELSELRKMEHTRRAREEHNLKMSEWELSIANAGLIPGEDGVRPSGLPEGYAVYDVWVHILGHVDDTKDIESIQGTCHLFREIVKSKYRTNRLIEVVFKFTNTLGGLPTLLSLRGVCRACKRAVDQRLLEDRLHYEWNFEAILDYNLPHHPDDQWIPKPELHFHAYQEGLPRLQSIVRKLELQNVPSDSFPVRVIYMKECGWSGREDAPTLRLQFTRFLELVGSSIRYFKYQSNQSNLATYDQLRSWMPLMPNLEDLSVGVDGDVHMRPPELPLSPFPTCPRLKRFVFRYGGMRGSFVAPILLANPQISDVRIYFYGPLRLGVVGSSEVTAFQEALASTRVERFNLDGTTEIPRQQILGFRLQWPLKYLSLTISVWDENHQQSVPSRLLINFVNSFRLTLEELTVNWRLRDTGGFLDVPKVKKLLWKLWPDFMSTEFMVGLENLVHLDLDLASAVRIQRRSRESAGTFIDNLNLPPLFPTLKEIRSKIEGNEKWFQVWKS